MRKIIACVLICFVVVSNIAMVANAANNTFSLTLTSGSPAYVQAPRSSNEISYVTVCISNIAGNLPVHISVVDSSHKIISESKAITSVGSYILYFNTPIASGTDVYVMFYSGYYSINISGYVA